MGAPKVKAGTVIAGRYRIVSALSRGGMGSVWRAEHLALGSPIAIKLIDSDLVEHEELRARFEQEARAAAALRSPNVVQILDHGVDKGLPFIAMELLEGESLAHRLARMGSLPHVQTGRIFLDVARAVKKAHDLGIIHRDLKPDNIFLVRNEDQEIAKILDFGIAKAQNPLGEWKGGTRTGALIGTPQYMSPEQAQGMPVTKASDIWALGVIAFECVCGRMPFPSEKPGELILQICAKPMPVPSQIARVPPRFDAWFARACNRDPGARFQSAKELAEALVDVLGLAVANADTSGAFQVALPAVAAALLDARAPGGAAPAVEVAPAVSAPLSPAQLAAPVVPIVAPGPIGAPASLAQPPGAVMRSPAGTEISPGALGPSGTLGPSGPVDAPRLRAPNGPRALATAALDAPVDATMSGGAVMDSDPATLVKVPASSRKKAAIALAMAGTAAVAFALVWTVARPSAPSGAASDGAAQGSLASGGQGPSVTPAPSPGESSAPSAQPESSGAPSTSAAPSGSPSPGAAAPSGSSGRKNGSKSVAPPVRSGAPATSSSNTRTNTRIGW
jgi:serine/threonine-protein kinase